MILTDVLFEVCKWIAIVLAIYTTPLMAWMVISSLAGFFKPKELEKKEDKQHNFAVIICARNEESVLPQLIGSLKKQDYEKYKCFVIADNCTDSTAIRARQEGAIVYERFNDTQKGKGYALQWGLKLILEEYADEYDAICVFDADNLAAPNFLTEMNNALCSGGHIAIGYRDTKNIHDSWVSQAYSIYWLMLMRFYHAARQKMGLSSMVGGTGFAFKTEILGSKGWVTHSLTEDVEFSIQQILDGKSIVPARKAVFYDEQPVSFGVSVRQRLRWMIGGMQCIPLYLPRIMKSVFSGNIKALDLAWYILFIPASGLSVILNVATVVSMLLIPNWQGYTLLLVGGMFALSWIFTTLIGLLTLVLEKRSMHKMFLPVLLFPVFMFSMMFISLAAIIRPKTEWLPIEHKSKSTIDDMNL